MDSPAKSNAKPAGRVIAIGASAGGIDALRTLLEKLPADLAAPVLIVQHIGAVSVLAAVLDQAGPLQVKNAENGETIEAGTVYVAVPDSHLLLHEDHILLRRGPHENLSRPAIDPTFRSVACSRGAGAIGVVLSGALNDGTAGLRAIKRCGGIAVVQDPLDAMVPEMPASAISKVEVDHVLPVAAMAALLERLAREPITGTTDPPFDVCLEAAIAAQELPSMSVEDELGKPSKFSCPECHGTLWEIPDGNVIRFRCHTGHAFTAEAMLAAQEAEAEAILYSLMRSHNERAELVRRLAEKSNSPQLADRLAKRAAGYQEGAEVLRRLLMLHGGKAGASITGENN